MTRPGDFVGAYQLVRHLGEGPFGMVWLARASSGETCVLKLLRPGFVERPEGQAAFSRLATSVQVHGRLHHPNLVEIIEAVQDPSRRLFGLAMGYVEGQALADTQIPESVIQGRDLRGLATILSWFEELGAVLSWLHTQRIVHGNLKPTNVVLTEMQGRSVVKVLDLCWAAIGIAAPPPNATWSVSPEQLRGQPPTKESDQWALASMLTRMITGGHTSLRSGALPPVLVSALTRALDESPVHRYANMAELVSALRSIRMDLEQRARVPHGAVDFDDFQDEPATVRAPKAGRRAGNGMSTPLRHDTPPMPARPSLEPTHRERNPLSRKLRELPLVPESRVLSKEISDENSVSSPSLKIAYEATSGEHAAPAVRHDIGDPFEGPLVPDEFDSTENESEPSLGITPGFVDTGSRVSASMTIPPRSRSKLATYGAVFFVIAALITVAALVILSDEQNLMRDRVPPPIQAIAERPVQPPDAPAPPAVEEPPPPAPPPPPPEAPPPAPKPVERSKPAERSTPAKEKPKEKSKAPLEGAPAQKEEIDDLDAKADEALAKLLGQPAPPPKVSDRELSVGCDEGDGKACVEWGDRLAKRKSDKAVKVFERACSFEMADGCHRAALLLGDDPKVAELEERACQLGRSESCRIEVAKTSTTG